MSSGIPFFYDYINHCDSSYAPNKVQVRNTRVFQYFQRQLLQDAISVTKWELPENWNKNYFLYGLYCFGYMAVIETDKFGIIPQGCGLRGYNVMYQPTHAIISNPLISRTLEPQIGVNCEIIKLMPDYGSIMPIVNLYAEQLAIAYETFITNLYNSKFSWVFAAKNKASAESFKKMFDKISGGDPAVFVDKDLLDETGQLNWQQFNSNVGGNYIADTLQMTMNRIKDEFNTTVGIPSANTDKKERQIVDEVNANNVETFSKPDLWLESMKEGCEKVNKMFGTSLSVEFRSQPKENTVSTMNKQFMSDNPYGGDEAE